MERITRLILKEEDVLLVKLPISYFRDESTVRILYTEIKKRLLPRKNKILMIPNEIDISVIGKKEIKEHITNIDLWNLWSKNGELITGED